MRPRRSHLLVVVWLAATVMLLTLSAPWPRLFVVRPVSAAEAICSQPAVIFCDDFESGNLKLWQDGYDPARHTVITSKSPDVYQGTRALEVLYPEGDDGGWLTRWFMPGHDDVYVRLYAKWESHWQNSSNGGDKTVGLYGNRIDNQWSGFGKAGIKPTGTDFFLGMLTSRNWDMKPDPGEMIFYSYFPAMTPAPDGMYWGTHFLQDQPRIGIQPGQWYCLELELKANTPGLPDGYQKMWINGQFKGQVTGMRWRDTTDLRINAVQLSFSGAGPQTERKWIDAVVVSTQRIGCLAANPPSPPTGLIVR
jgi:hypothetical protein